MAPSSSPLYRPIASCCARTAEKQTLPVLLQVLLQDILLDMGGSGHLSLTVTHRSRPDTQSASFL